LKILKGAFARGKSARETFFGSPALYRFKRGFFGAKGEKSLHAGDFPYTFLPNNTYFLNIKTS